MPSQTCSFIHPQLRGVVFNDCFCGDLPCGCEHRVFHSGDYSGDQACCPEHAYWGFLLPSHTHSLATTNFTRILWVLPLKEYRCFKTSSRLNPRWARANTEPQHRNVKKSHSLASLKIRSSTAILQWAWFRRNPKEFNVTVVWEDPTESKRTGMKCWMN